MSLFTFPAVSCSGCGENFGPGDHGFSYCQNHTGMRPVHFQPAPRISPVLEAAKAFGRDFDGESLEQGDPA
jgi:hypothetical protein